MALKAWQILKETICFYGETDQSFTWDEDKEAKEGFLGPFYCGMSSVMTIPQFTMQLFSPTSTSCHIEVAMKFSGDNGIIIQFDNEGGMATGMEGLDVSWISRYKEEDER